MSSFSASKDLVDLVIYKSTQDNQCNDNENYKACICITRLLVALKYYSRLNIIENHNDRELFRQFMNEIYYELINDYIHFNNHHTHEVEHINDDLVNDNNNTMSFNKCEISSCQFTTRHHHTKTIENDLDDILNFYKRTMDSLHFYLFHCFDVGIRTKTQDEEPHEEKQKSDQYFDDGFSRINKLISERKHVTKNFDRFSTNQNSKFSIMTQQDEQIENDEDDSTYLDAIFYHLKSKNVKSIHVKKLIDYLQEEKHDTDSVTYDIDINGGNIAQAVNDDACIDEIRNFTETAKVSSTSFAVGLRFYYWSYYKELKQLDMDEVDIQ
eukprot:373958_1